jgi:protein-L-isoaspartate(D-aspartate) O-methyltransferase
VKEVYTVEIIPELAEKASDTLKKLEIENVYIKKGSGEFGWPEKAPYDAIIITAGLGEDVPQTLFNQLNEGGILVAPVGEGQDKKMTRFIKSAEEINKEEFGTFHFVPFVESN